MKQLLVGFALGLMCAAFVLLRDDGRADAADRAYSAAIEPAAPLAGTNCGCPGDLNGDSQVNVSDLLLLLGAWGACPGCQSDVECDDGVPCTVDFCDGSTCVNDPIPGCCFFGTECSAGETCCNGTCENTDSDPQNCGGCNIVCGPGNDCVNGSCVTSSCASNLDCPSGHYCDSFNTCVPQLPKGSACTESRQCMGGLVCFDGFCTSPQTWYADADEDGWGDCADSIMSVDPIPPYTAEVCGDCDDANPNVHPGAVEIACNDIDDDCDGIVDEDGNEGMACNTGLPGQCAAGTFVCNNGTLTCMPITGPSPEICNDGIDNSCNGTVDCQDPTCAGLPECP